ncbi:hypothetical protein [Bifidobacterium callimiconis]|uniref:Uncharacterized protein n=1 Tax=Bifidobacterium callimiconis TaxID=2306973 RepID=A0A430FDI2_9BIFI|nr:hypothetical protein [Bifidobacterium callimiconis]MBT1176908.1 hypothetical protein [Bifidobacterium callimiconis]RSX50851.1 hypothetical protein D2E23_1142 [Bifidobacterium callimiconis]
MGLFGGDYKVVKVGLFGFEETVLENVDLDEAKRFIDDNSGFFGDGNTYKIVKGW